MNPLSHLAIAVCFLACVFVLRGAPAGAASVDGAEGVVLSARHGQLPKLDGRDAVHTDSHERTLIATPDYFPTPDPVSRDIPPGQTVRVLPYAVWKASLVIPADVRDALVRACFCETRWNEAAHIIDTNGQPSDGACQVQPVWSKEFGPVPQTLEGQFRQAGAIAEKYGTWPWASTVGGCREFNS